MNFLILLALGFVLETIRVSLLARVPVAADIVLGLVVVVGLVRRQPAGALLGFVLGLQRDWFYGGPAGFHTLTLTCLGAVMGSLGRTIYRDSFVTHAVMIAAAVLARGVAEFMVVSGGSPHGLHLYLGRVVLPGAVLSALIVPGVYHLFVFWRRRREAVDIEAILAAAARREAAEAETEEP